MRADQVKNRSDRLSARVMVRMVGDAVFSDFVGTYDHIRSFGLAECVMPVKPQFTIHEAVARCFPTSLGYDQKAADRLIKWLESCGYEIRPIEQAPLVPEPSDRDRLSVP
jgi:hypothetical protein